jgi:hypothetical protein
MLEFGYKATKGNKAFGLTNLRGLKEGLLKTFTIQCIGEASSPGLLPKASFRHPMGPGQVPQDS